LIPKQERVGGAKRLDVFDSKVAISIISLSNSRSKAISSSYSNISNISLAAATVGI